MWIRCLLVALLLAPLAATAQEEDDPRRIIVTGEGEVEVAPDMATIGAGVTTEAPGAREAIDSNSRAMEGVLERLRDAGIAARDLQTSDFSVHPRWSSQRETSPAQLVAFVARNTLTVRVRELDRLGEILDQVVRDGANSFAGLSFGLQDPQPAEDAARQAAVAEARRKATLYAAAAGVQLGPLLELSEDAGTGRPAPLARAEMRMAADAVPVAAGELTVTARVTLVYEIAD